jgi:hypothetical protein
MNRTTKRQAPAGYRLRVEGHLEQRWSAWFDDLTVTRESDGTTSLSGDVSDQAELHGLLMKIRDLGITLISVNVIDPTREGNPQVGVTPLPQAEPADVRGEMDAGAAAETPHAQTQ